MPSRNIAIDTITKIEGNAGLKVIIEDGVVKDLQFIVTEQTRALRRLAYDGLMIRDHALHLYFFVLPDILGVDSILIFPMIQTIPATHSCTIPWISSGSAQTPENHTGR
jgi:coenzyme F420-reducing hydrogenase alpha subunit